MDYSEVIESFLTKPYWIIDILPEQVPSARQKQYFETEKYFMQEPQRSVIHQQFCNLLVKLGCYHDLVVFNADGLRIDGPLPGTLTQVFASRQPFFVLIDSDEAMIAYNGDDHNLTLYTPAATPLPLLARLATAERLFLWQPPKEKSQEGEPS